MKAKQTAGFTFALSLTVCLLLETTSLAVYALSSERYDKSISGTIMVSKPESSYPKLAKINMEEAMSIASQRVHGDVLKVELTDEDNFLVYNIEVVTSEKEIVEITIDSGNGKILFVEEDEND
ncbi:PepSY domain-containing protein [Desulfogranum japonicum]|uniref:PepSY domain-containing protein n=1 Tax=Desulfogranum japonicum TaxID=231447 RepID=UPI000683DCF5|nr:PepSY domain-containing protein [Desulfogranum japonicum]